MKVLLTFLGTNPYNETTYTWQDGEQELEKNTKFVAQALNEFFNTDTVKVFLTEQAREKHWEDFQASVPNAEDISIPSGQVEDELWQIFEAVVNSVEPNDEVILDVTHSFRSIPLFVFLAGIYLQKSSNVTIKGVYYGAYERDRERSPIFDLTPTLSLIEWLTATDKFINTGSATELGQLLKNIQRDFYKQGRQKHESVSPRSLISFGNKMQNISESIELARPLELMEQTASLETINYDNLQQEVGIFAKPFKLLLDRIQTNYTQFSLSNPRETDPYQALAKQFDLIQWYIDHSLRAQAILLAREWLISVLCIELGRNYLNGDERGQIEYELNTLVQEKQKSDNEKQKAKPLSANAFEKIGLDLDNLLDTWSDLRDKRNDLAHTGMRIDPLTMSRMSKFSDDILSNLNGLFMCQV